MTVFSFLLLFSFSTTYLRHCWRLRFFSLTSSFATLVPLFLPSSGPVWQHRALLFYQGQLLSPVLAVLYRICWYTTGIRQPLIHYRSDWSAPGYKKCKPMQSLSFPSHILEYTSVTWVKAARTVSNCLISSLAPPRLVSSSSPQPVTDFSGALPPLPPLPLRRFPPAFFWACKATKCFKFWSAQRAKKRNKKPFADVSG